MSRRLLAALGAALSLVAAAACGDVPTAEANIAYITGIILKSPAVEAGGTLRDSLGNPVPLEVRAFDRDSNPVTGVPVTYLVSPIDTGVHVDAAGFLTVSDSVRTISLVARVGSVLQTPAATLDVVPPATTLSRRSGSAATDTAVTLPAFPAETVLVTGVRRGATVPVRGIIVRYAIDSLYPSTAPSGSAVLAIETGRHLADSTRAVDTTDASGLAARSVRVLAGSGVTRVVVRATATDLRGRPLSGSPVRFALPVK